jgi:hypothetical protein
MRVMQNELKEWQVSAAEEINEIWCAALTGKGDPPDIRTVAGIIAEWALTEAPTTIM